jgi:SAM-dependent methyltransferase
MSTSDEPREQRRLSFGAVAEQYDRRRPGYPAQMVKDVITYADAQPGDRALEVGAGTGKATLLFAAQGLEVTAVEPDPDMAALAAERAALAGLKVSFLGTDFEAAFDQAGLPEHAFKLLFSATAWHWVTPSLRNQLAARALVSGGALAPFWNRPVWSQNPLRPALEEVYDAIDREYGVKPAGPMNPWGQPAEIKSENDWLELEFPDRDTFTDIEVRHYENPQRYSAQEYVELTATHSDHQVLEPQVREQLLKGISAAIDAAGGSFELAYETLLCLARRV